MEFSQYFFVFIVFLYLFASVYQTIANTWMQSHPFGFQSQYTYISYLVHFIWLSYILSLALVLSHSLWYSDIWHRTLEWNSFRKMQSAQCTPNERWKKFPLLSVTPSSISISLSNFCCCCWCWVSCIAIIVAIHLLVEQRFCTEQNLGSGVDPVTNFIRTHFN